MLEEDLILTPLAYGDGALDQIRALADPFDLPKNAGVPR